MLHNPELFSSGYHLSFIAISDDIKTLVREEKWNEVDAHFKRLTGKGGTLYNFLRKYHDFESIEFIISVRDAENAWEEDGIWHDDGSRVFAFSLSLNIHPHEIEGGNLELRMKESPHSELIPTPEFGTAILFLTGVHGYEHRTHRVKKGSRVMLVGWCVK